MDELKKQIKTELKETSVQDAEATHALVPSPKAVTQAGGQSKFQPTQVMVNRLRLLRQGSWFGLIMCLVATALPLAMQLNFLPIIWIALCAEIVGLASVLPPSKLLPSPAKFTAISLVLTVVVPLLFVLLCGQFAEYLPKKFLIEVTSPLIYWAMTLVVMVPMAIPVFRAIQRQLSAGTRTKSNLVQRFGRWCMTMVIFFFFLQFFTFCSSWCIFLPLGYHLQPGFLGVGCILFFILAITAHLLSAPYREILNVETTRDNNISLLP